MSALEFHCSGNGALHYYLFNGIAGLFNDGRIFSGTFGAMTFCALAVTGTTLVYRLASNLKLEEYFTRIAGAFVIFNLLFMPKSNLMIIDHMTGQEFMVANVPTLLAAGGSLSTSVGYSLAKNFESAFRGPVVSNKGHKVNGINQQLSYAEGGTTLASNLAARAMQFRIYDDYMSDNMSEFVSTCILGDALAINYRRYTAQELAKSKDPWALIKQHATYYRYITWSERGKTPVTVSCAVAAQKFDEVWPSLIKEAKEYQSYRLMPSDPEKGSEFLSRLGISYQYLTDVAVDTDKAFQMAMLKNSLAEGTDLFRIRSGRESAVYQYVMQRSLNAQRTAAGAIGHFAGPFLTKLAMVVETLLYGIFPIVAIIAVLPGGFAILKKYFYTFLWLQSWPLLYSLLNLMMSVYAKQSSAGALYGAKNFSLAALGQLGVVNSEIVQAAQGMMPFIPLISLGIFAGGPKGFALMAQSLQQQMFSNIDREAAAASSGNYSSANTSWDNHSRGTSKYDDHNYGFRVEGGNSWTMNNPGGPGSTTQYSDGTGVIDNRGTVSNLGTYQIGGHQQFSAGVYEAARHSHSSGIAHMQDAQEQFSNNWTSSFGKDHRELYGQNWQNQDMNSDAYSFQQADQSLRKHAQALSHQLGISEQDAGKLLFGVNAKGTAGTPTILKAGLGFGAEFSTNLGTEKSKTISVDDAMRKAEDYAKENNLTEVWQKHQQASKNLTQARNSSDNFSQGTQYAASFSNGYNVLDAAKQDFQEQRGYEEFGRKSLDTSISENKDLSNKFVHFALTDEHSPYHHNLNQLQHHIANENPQIDQMVRKFGVHCAKENFESMGMTSTMPNIAPTVKETLNQHGGNITDNLDLNVFANKHTPIDPNAQRMQTQEIQQATAATPKQLNIAGEEEIFMEQFSNKNQLTAEVSDQIQNNQMKNQVQDHFLDTMDQMGKIELELENQMANAESKGENPVFEGMGKSISDVYEGAEKLNSAMGRKLSNKLGLKKNGGIDKRDANNYMHFEKEDI